MASSKRPRVPSRYSSLMSGHTQENLRNSQVRSSSAASTVSSRSTVSEFMEAKIGQIDGELEYVEQYQRGLKDVFATRKVSKRDIDAESESLEESTTALQRELVIVKRQRKTLEEDLMEKPSTQQIEEAYAASVLQRVLAATAKQPKQKFLTKPFRAKAEEYYGAVGMINGIRKVWCPLSGWVTSDDAKCAHIVPRILTSDELSHLYGVGELPLTDPKNALLLHKKLEEALDAARIAIVPISGKANEATRWKAILIDKTPSNMEAYLGAQGVVKWKEIDGKELTFLNENRPARRYLYFRYIMTYMSHKKHGTSMEWAEKLDDKGRMWATPGPYLRRSMLQNLARFVSHDFLPEALIEDNTFTEAPSCPSRDNEAEETLAMSLAVRIKDAEKEERDDDEEDDDEEDDDADDL